MKCYVCGMDKIENKARCPLCGFPVPRIVEDGEQGRAKVKEMAEKYRRKKLEGLKAGMVIYGHEKDGENLKINQEQYIQLAECPDLKIGETRWYDQDFARIDTAEPIVLKVWTQKQQDPIQFYTVSAKAPDTDGFWHVGIRLLQELKLQLILGDDEEETESETISLAELI